LAEELNESAPSLNQVGQRDGQADVLVVAEVRDRLDLERSEKLLVVRLGQAGECRRRCREDFGEGLVLVCLVEGLFEVDADCHERFLSSDDHGSSGQSKQ
jgi:hypothetical protein